MLKDDLFVMYEASRGSKWTRVRRMFLAPGVRAVVIYRFSRWVSLQPFLVRAVFRPFSSIARYRLGKIWGIEIDPGATIGKRFRIVHFGGIFIGSKVIIGDDFFISHDVTIGLAGTGNRRGAPTIGNNVYVAPGAKIAGRIRIGSNVKIGANTVIERNIPDNALVQLPPPRVVIFPGYVKDDSTTSPSGGSAPDQSPAASSR